MSDYVLGIDISRWQDDNSTPQRMDFEKAKKAGARYVGIKVSQSTWLDEDFIWNWDAAKDAGLHRMAYHYLDPFKEGKDQADFFLGAIAKDPPEIGVVADYEYRSSTPDMMYAILLNFAQAVNKTDYRKILYTSPWYWRNYGREDASYWWSSWDLWIANYEVNEPDVPGPWDTWKFWQHSNKGSGYEFGAESAYIDLNFYNGTWDDFRAEYGTIVVDPPVITDEYEEGYKEGYGSAVVDCLQVMHKAVGEVESWIR